MAAEKNYVELDSLSDVRIVRDLDLEGGRTLKLSFRPYALTVEDDRQLQAAYEASETIPTEYMAKALVKVGLKVGKAAEDASAPPMTEEEIGSKMTGFVLMAVYGEVVKGMRPNLTSDGS